MYRPKVFEENRIEVLHELIRNHPFGTLVTLNGDGLQANHMPFELESAPEPYGTLYAHVARANPLWRDIALNSEALAIFQGPHGYISPAWYLTKQETGMVVPTWNYAVVHAHGNLQSIEDPIWLRAFVERLTKTNEQYREQPWNVSDAPADYIEKQLTAIVGLKLTITRLIGKWKLSQNRPAQDRVNVIDTLFGQANEASTAMAGLMKKVNDELESTH